MVKIEFFIKNTHMTNSCSCVKLSSSSSLFSVFYMFPLLFFCIILFVKVTYAMKAMVGKLHWIFQPSLSFSWECNQKRKQRKKKKN